MKIIWIYKVEVDNGTHITTWRETYKHLKNDHDIHYLFPYDKVKRGFCSQITYIKTFNLPYIKRLTYLINSFIEFVKINKKVKADLVILDVWSFFFSVIYIFRKKKPIVILDHRTAIHNETTNTANSFSNKFLLFFTKAAVWYNRKYQDGVSYISEGLHRQLQNDVKVKLHPDYHIWPSGVDTELFQSTTVAEVPGPDKPVFSVFFHGGLTPNRGLVEIIEAIALLKEHNLPVTFTIIGAGKYLDTLQDSAKSLKVTDQVSFLGLQPYETIPGLIQQADLCMLAYPLLEYWEGNVPLKILEYMAMEKVVLCSELRVFRNITESANCAVFVKDNDPANIAEGIKYAMENRRKLSLWGKEGREIVERRFTWKAISEGLNEFFSSYKTD